MRITFLLLATLISNSFTGYSQDYVVNIQMDTIYGEIDILLPGDYTEDLVVKSEDNKERFKAHQILEANKEGEIYHPVKWANKYRLMKLETPGYLSIYSYRGDEGYEFNTKFLLKKTEEGMEVPNLTFKKLISEFLADCPEVSQKVDDKSLKKKDLDQIVEEYNNCIGQKTHNKYEGITETLDDEQLSQLQLLDRLIAKSSNQSELLTLLKDIKAKVTSKQNIPNYLITALKDQTKEMTSVQNDVEAFLATIK